MTSVHLNYCQKWGFAKQRKEVSETD